MFPDTDSETAKKFFYARQKMTMIMKGAIAQTEIDVSWNSARQATFP